MLKAKNYVKVEGILAENDLKIVTYTNKVTGEQTEAISGSIKVLVDDGTKKGEYPIYVFSNKYITGRDELNPSYLNLEKVMKEFVSLAAAESPEQADKVRITGASIRVNDFVGQSGKLVSQPRITASYINKVTGKFEPQATFDIIFVVSNLTRAVDSEGVELDPAVLNVEAIIPQYITKSTNIPYVDVMKFVVKKPNVIHGIEQAWESGKTYEAAGTLDFTTNTKEIKVDMGIGDSISTYRTQSIHDFVITAGSATAFEGDYAFSIDDIKAGLAERKGRLERLQSKATPTYVKSTPAPSKNAFGSMGF